MTLTRTNSAEIRERIRARENAGRLGRIGLWVLDHARGTALLWIAVVLGLGIVAPQVESRLSGAGWQDDGSPSVAARELAQEHFGGSASSAIQVVLTGDAVTSGRGERVIAQVRRLLLEDPRIADVVDPVPGATVSRDGRSRTRPLGQACRRWTTTDSGSEEVTSPTPISAGTTPVFCRPPSNHAAPANTSSGPRWLTGRRHHARSPAAA